MLQNGAVVAGKYKILQKIGAGGMSTVYLAEDLHLNKKWTVKEIIKSGQEKKDQINLSSLIAEANLIKKIDHPSIPRIVDIIDTKSTVFIIRDFIDGEPMHQVIRIYGAQPENAVVEWAKQLCDVLDYLHHMSPKVIYRDMKPSNIMLMPDGSLRLIDFGIAQEVGKDEDDMRMRTGTKGYAPAEQMRADRKTDERSDIYALGMTLYQIATGISPASAGFDRNRLVCEHNPKISVRLSKIIDKCIQENPDDRFQNCAELRYALGKLSGHDFPEDKKANPLFQKIGRAACTVLFFASVLLGLLSTPLAEAGGLLHWTVDGMLNCKNVYFLCAILFLLFYILLRKRNEPQTAPSAERLQGTSSTSVVSKAQEGSMMDMLQTGSTSGLEFGRAMDTSEAVDNGASLLADRSLAQKAGRQTVPVHPISLLDGSALDRQGADDVQLPSNAMDVPYAESEAAEGSPAVWDAAQDSEETQSLDVPLNDVTQSLEEPQNDDVTQFLDEPQNEDVTQFLEEPQNDDVTQFLEEPQNDDVTQFLEEPQNDDVTQFLEEPQNDDVTQFLEEPQNDDVTQFLEEPQNDDVAQFLDKPQNDDVTQFLEEPQNDDVTQFLEEPQNDDVTQFLDEPQNDDVTQFLDEPQNDDVTQFLEEPQNDDVTQFLEEPQNDDVTQFLDEPQNDDVTQFLDEPQNDDVTQFLEEPQNDDVTQFLEEPQNDDVTQFLEKPQNDDVTQFLEEPQNDDVTQFLEEPQNEDVTQFLEEPQNDDVTQFLDEPQNEDVTQFLEEPQNDDVTQFLDEPQEVNGQFRVLRSEIVVHSDEII